LIDKLKKPWRNAALAALVLLVGWFCWTIRAVLNPLILGYLLAYVAHPMVLKLERRGWSRRTAVNVIFIGTGLGLALVTVFGFLQGRSLVLRLSDPQLHERMWTRLERELEQHEGKIAWITAHLPGRGGEPAPDAAPDAVQEPAADGPAASALSELRAALEEWTAALFAGENLSQTRDTGLAAAGVALAFLQRLFGSILAFGTLLVLLPIYTYVLLFELERIHRFVRHYLPAGERTRLSRVGVQIGEVLASFFRGRLLVCLLKGLCYTLGLWIAGIDYALLIGLGTGFLSLVPFVGSLVGLVAACLVGFFEHSLVGSLVRAGVVFGVVELLENYVLVPKILGDTLALHPVVVIAAIMAGGAAFGMFGLLVALPVTAALVILTREFVLPTLEQIARGDGARPERPV
jgi:predicted PurR-regulated permease PerM